VKYLCDPQIIPTNTCPPDFSELGKRTEEFAVFSPSVQLDIADGIFAPVTSWPYQAGQLTEFQSAIAHGVKLPLAEHVLYEVHLMVSDVREVGLHLSRAGATRLLPHVEVFENVESAREVFKEWKDAGVRETGLSILLDTPLNALDPFIADCDVVQLVSIAKIGAQGQPFDERALTRVEELHARYPDLMVAVDGGVSEANIESLVRAGANRLCVGSAISKSENPALSFAHIHERAMMGCAPASLQTTD